MASEEQKGSGIYIAVYRPHKGKDAELRALIKDHAPTLRRLDLITGRPAVVMKAKDGSYIEICEWATPDSGQLAHGHPEVAKIWQAMGEVADFLHFEDLEESKVRFPHFKPVDF